jgi:hypothetical protein
MFIELITKLMLLLQQCIKKISLLRLELPLEILELLLLRLSQIL